MTIQKIKRRLPALYRWSRRRRYFPHAVIVVCALLFLPLGVATGTKISNMISANKALAATRAIAPEHSVMEVIPEKERMRFGQTLIGLVLDEPQRLETLIGHDFLVMFNEPALKRKEGATHIWQYRTHACVLDVFFEDASKSVTHYEIRVRKIAAFGVEGQHEHEVNERSCLKDIYEQSAA